MLATYTSTSGDIHSDKTPTSSLNRHNSSESASSEGVKCIPYNPTSRESISGVSITMKTQPRKEGYEVDHKTTTRIDFGDHFPDGGWGWIVTGAATLVFILCNGFHFAFGTLYLCILDKTDLNTNEIHAGKIYGFQTAGSYVIRFSLS